ncbi:cyclohexadieny/prephenate dehydrogenase [Maritalea mobilis]|uniref:prephenate dehydrogenase n=1 Tax=Maritalea mobilis TaxID=483324 RepID=A0A4V6PX18_9HYPH|nr:prephenate/arogenate dehydrogenase family protein [Maritalea mobilis]TDQ61590.1 cyclohexadieny/prephenate dehydrogenase [Maritalea mobilis]
MAEKPLFDRIAIIGIGLIGSSIARAILRGNLTDELVISDRSPQHLSEAEKLELGHAFHANPSDAVKDADLVILCTPVGTYREIGEQIAAGLKAGAIVSDVGSVKEHVVNALQDVLPAHVDFIPGHPISGTEKSGPKHGFAELFDQRFCILTPTEDASQSAIDRLKAFWEAIGSDVEIMDAKHHDLVLAITSHVPHLIAYNIVGTADDLESVTKSEVIKFSAGGFRDFTRIAASDPIMWRDVFLTNRDAVLEMLGRFLEDLSMLQRAVRDSDGEMLEGLFTRTRNIRRSIIDAGQETDAPDFGRKHHSDKAE